MGLSPQITLTATLEGINGTAAGSVANPAKLRIALAGFGRVIPQIPGTTTLALVGPLDLLSSSGAQIETLLWGNDVILPLGTYYAITILDGEGNIVQTGAYQFTGTQIIDLSDAPQIVPSNSIAYESCAGVYPGTVYVAPGVVVIANYNGVALRPGIDYTLSNGGKQINLTFSTTDDEGENISALCTLVIPSSLAPGASMLQYAKCDGDIPGTVYTAPAAVVSVYYNGDALPLTLYSLDTTRMLITLHFTTSPDGSVYALCVGTVATEGGSVGITSISIADGHGVSGTSSGGATPELALDVTGNITPISVTTTELQVNGDAVIDGTLGTTGLATLAGLQVNGVAVISGTLGTTGLATLAALQVNGNANIESVTTTELQVNGDAVIDGTLGTTGLATLAGLQVNGVAVISGTLGTTGLATLAGLQVNGNAGVSGGITSTGLQVNGNANIGGITSIGSGASPAGLQVFGGITSTGLLVNGNAVIDGTLGTIGLATLAGLQVNGDAVIDGTLGTTGLATLAGLQVNGVAVISGTLGTTGLATLAGLQVNGNAGITGVLEVGGHITAVGGPISELGLSIVPLQVTLGPGAGSGALVQSVAGLQGNHTIAIATGSSPAANSVLYTFTYTGAALNHTPYCIVQVAGTLDFSLQVQSGSTFYEVIALTSPTPNTEYFFVAICP